MKKVSDNYNNCRYTATYDQSGEQIFPWTVRFVRNATEYLHSGRERIPRGAMSPEKFASHVEGKIKKAVEKAIDSEIKRSG